MSRHRILILRLFQVSGTRQLPLQGNVHTLYQYSRGCGLCCLLKIEDEDTGEIFNTSVCCQRLIIETCRCSDYENRLADIPMCRQITLDALAELDWLPETCAYRLLAEGESLPNWHPLITGDPDSVIKAGISVRDIAKSNCDPENLFPEIISFSADLKTDSDEA